MSRKIDALVAEHVMGLETTTAWGEPFIVTETLLKENGLPHKICITLPAYSTDISAAWEVVEKLRALPNTWVRFNAYEEYDCYIEQEGEITTGSYHQKAMPMAICLAALKLKGIDHGQITT
jgi:hypothetical protein